MNYQITNINLNDETPDCNTPTEIVSCIMSICNQIFPNMQPELTGFENMNDYQIAYSFAKVMYEQLSEEAEKETEAECKRIGLVLKRGDREALDKWSEIDSKYDEEFAVNHLMYLKWQAESLMVENAFRTIEADPKIKKQIVMNEKDYNRVKMQWESPVIRQDIIDLAFKLKA